MNEPETLIKEELIQVLQMLIDQNVDGEMTYQTRGRWHLSEVSVRTLTDSAIQVEVKSQEKPVPSDIQIDQPVGISIQHEFNKYIFETTVAGFEPSVNDSCGGTIALDLPDRMDRMQRRAYNRVSVPEEMNVKVLFWHRGYMDNSTEAPLENYWQGRLIDLSAGGLQIGIDIEEGANFRAAQLVGLQFTPMSYEKPILLEAQVKHLAEHADDKQLYVGVEFIGLESSGEGRQKLRQLIDIVTAYEKKNLHIKSPPNPVHF